MDLIMNSEAHGMTVTHQGANSAMSLITTERFPGNPVSALSPVEVVLAGLNGCMAVVAQMVAQELGITVSQMNFRTKGSLDERGIKGEAGVSPTFQTVELEATVWGPLSEDQVQQLKRHVAGRCPIHTLFTRAGVQVLDIWRLG